MRKTTIVTIAAVVATGACLAGRLNAGSLYKDGKYDFFGLSRYPEGGKLVEGVDLYKVEMEGDGNPRAYHRRVTQWWPRKGVDRIEIQDGMILREWTRTPSALDPDDPAGEKGEPVITDYDSFAEIPRNAGKSYMRRVRGFITPGRDDDYSFTVSADDDGFMYISSDDTEANKRLVCYKWGGGSELYRKRPSRFSKPIALKKGRKYYYEVVHLQYNWGDHIEVFWQTPATVATLLCGDEFSTLDGVKGKFRAERWDMTSPDAPRHWGLPRTFKAHLIGFHGVGNDIGDPFAGEDFYTPAVVLRMEDGTKRTFQGNTLCRADQEFIIDLYVKEMKRIRTYEDQTPREVWGGAKAEYPNNAKPGQPGTMRFDTRNFSFGSGSQTRHGSNYINDEEPEKAARCRESVFAGAEYWHSYLEYGGHLMNGWMGEGGNLGKFLVRVTGYIRDGHIHEPAVNNGGVGSCRVAGPSSMTYGLFHEMGHGMPNTWRIGGGEIFADFQQDLATGGRASKNLCSISAPYRMPLYWMYPTCMFYSFIGEDPNWGYCMVSVVPTGRGEKTFFQTVARLGEQRGMFKNGIRGLGDTVGEFSARYAEFDYQNREHLRLKWFACMRNYLEAVDSGAGVYRIPWDEAPEPFGCNIIRLDPTPGSTEITADFQGYYDPATCSDWRACIVAVDKDDRCRYSPLWNKGLMKLARLAGDKRYWLTVAATPTGLLNDGELNRCYEGRWACRYPWHVTLTGALPGAPQHTRADMDDVYGTYGPSDILPPGRVEVPVTASNDRGRYFVEQAEAAIAQIDETLARTESMLQKNELMALRGKVQGNLEGAAGAPHPNGGGWVAATAFAAPTAYVGPKAMVLGAAKVLDHASVEEFGVVMGEAQLSGHARVNAQAIVRGKTHLSGYQRAWQPLDEDGPDSSLPELTPRDRKLGLDPNGLWVNYAMDESHAFMLENRYRHQSSETWPFFTDSQENGYLYGSPPLKVEGDRRGYAFDGKTQYAEMAPRAADMGAITVDMTLKWQGSGEQTLLDCGSDADNRFVLALGRGGRPEFTATVAGKKVAALSASEPVKPDEWTRVRLEIDGANIAIWVNDRKAGEEKSDFRPAHAFPSGGDKRNVVAAARDGSGTFKGVIDGVVVYHKVHGEAFAKLPPPILDAGRNPTLRQVYEAKVSRLGLGLEQAGTQKRQRVDEVMRYYNESVADAALRMHELRHRSPEWTEGLKSEKAGEFAKWQKEREDFHKKAMETDKDLMDLKKEKEALEKKLQDSYKAIEDELRTKRDELHKLEAERRGKGEAAASEIKDPQYLTWKSELAETDKALEAVRARVDAAIKAMPEITAIEEETQRLSAERKEIKVDIGKLEAEAFAQEAGQFAHWAAVADEIGVIQGRGLVHYRIAGAQSGALAARRKNLEEALREQLGQKHPDYKRAREIDARLADLNGKAKSLRERALVMEREHDELEYRKEILTNRVRDRENDLKLKREREWAEQPPTAEQAELQTAIAALEAKLGPDYEALKQQIGDCDRKYGERSNGYVKQKMMEEGLGEKTKANDEAFKALFEKAIAPHYLEYHAAMGFVRGAMASWANCTYGAFLGGGYGYRIPGSDPAGQSAPRDNPATVRAIAETYAPDNWLTSVDQWDWRTPWESDGSLKDRPLVQKWLKRVRGDVGSVEGDRSVR